MASGKEEVNNALRQYIWNYFQVHASQRLTTFNFYILISTVIATGYVVAVKDGGITILAMVFGIILFVLSFIFWKLDLRNRQLIKNAEEGLKYLEGKDGIEKTGEEPHILNIFRYEEKQTNEIKKNASIWPWKRLYTYSRCFGLVFLVFGILGLIGVIYSILVMTKSI